METRLDYQHREYDAVKHDIDQIIKTSQSISDVEAGKGRLLARSQRYVEYLAAATGATTAAVQDTLNELAEDASFFRSMAEGLDLLAQHSRAGLQTGELRVHSYTGYVAVRLLAPELMVETGVANGKSSSFILHAMSRNAKGKLYSIDLPEYEEAQKDEFGVGAGVIPKTHKVGWLVPENLRGRWELRLGDSRELLPRLQQEIGPIDVFQHDSLHTHHHMTFEIELAREWIRPRGVILVDDIQNNTAFEEQARSMNCAVFGTFGFLWNRR